MNLFRRFVSFLSYILWVAGLWGKSALFVILDIALESFAESPNPKHMVFRNKAVVRGRYEYMIVVLPWDTESLSMTKHTDVIGRESITLWFKNFRIKVDHWETASDYKNAVAGAIIRLAHWYVYDMPGNSFLISDRLASLSEPLHAGVVAYNDYK